MVLDYTKLFLFSFGTLSVQMLFMLLAFFLSAKFIKDEKDKLSAVSTHLDLVLISIFALVISGIISFAGTMGVSALAKYFFKNPEYLYNSFFELLLIFLTVLLASTVLFNEPREHLRLKSISAKEAKAFHKKFMRVTLVSMLIAVVSYSIVNTFVGTKYCLICEYGTIVAIVAYCFFELCTSNGVISRILVIRNTKISFVSEKIVSFLNQKFQYVMLFCMLYAVEINRTAEFNDVSAFTHINNVYIFLLAIICFQCIVVGVVNVLVEYINALDGGRLSQQLVNSRSKNICWICNFIVLTMYFVALCVALQYAGLDMKKYCLNEYFIVVVVGVFGTVMICRGFNEIRDSILEKAEKGDKAHYFRLKTFAPTITAVFYAVLLLTATLIILANLGFDVVAVIAPFSILSAAFAFASQDIIKAFISGLVLLVEKNLYVGDYVDVNGKAGTIERLSVRMLYLRDSRGYLHLIPYHIITAITNYSKGNVIRAGIIRLVDQNDIEKASKILKETVDSMMREPQYENKVFGGAQVYGLEPFDLTGVKVKWEVTTAPTLVHFLDDVYGRLAENFKEHGVKVPKISENICVVE